jgi:hypothetical protein
MILTVVEALHQDEAYLTSLYSRLHVIGCCYTEYNKTQQKKKISIVTDNKILKQKM